MKVPTSVQGPCDLRVDAPAGVDQGTYQNEAAYEICRLLSVIADRLDVIAERLPMAGKGF